ncbi:unnamed protein product, partial [Polarella glacialis]
CRLAALLFLEASASSVETASSGSASTLFQQRQQPKEWDQLAFRGVMEDWTVRCEARHKENGKDGLALEPSVLEEIRLAVQLAGLDASSRYAAWASDSPLSALGGSYAVAAGLLEAVALLPDCLADLVHRSELETRCPQKWYKIAIQKLFALGDQQGAEDLWRRARSIRRDSSGLSKPTDKAPLIEDEEAAIPWPSALQTPSIWVRGLRSEPFWDCHHAWPFVRKLEAHAGRILEEASRAAPQLQRAYPYLFAHGSWQNLFLFRGRTWNPEVCAIMPHTCRLLIPEIPTRPTLPFVVPNNEEIVLFRSEGGAMVGPHSGAVNNQINIHLTLVGGAGVFLQVAGERRELRAGKALCFQDSFLHSLEHVCEPGQKCEERISLVVRVTHPDVTMKHYKGFARTGQMRRPTSPLGESQRRFKPRWTG